jgi:hypothetical protein
MHRTQIAFKYNGPNTTQTTRDYLYTQNAGARLQKNHMLILSDDFYTVLFLHGC